MGDINFNDFLLSENSSFSMVTKQINDLAKIKDDFSERMCNEIKRYYEEWDQKLRDKYSGGYNGYKLYGKREVTTITEWGHVTYQRTLFKYYDSNKLNKDGRYGGNRFVFLLDAEMGRKPYQRIHFDLYIKVLKELDSGKRYQDIIDKYKDSKITPMTVSNIFRSIDLAEINENFKHTALHNNVKADSKYVYLGLDDTFTKIFKRHKKIDKNMVRLAYLCIAELIDKNLLRNDIFYKINDC